MIVFALRQRSNVKAGAFSDGARGRGVGTRDAHVEGMRIVVPAHQDRISPVLDAAQRFVVFDVDGDGNLHRREVRIVDDEVYAKASRIMRLAPDVLICGAVSRPLSSVLMASGMRVVGNTCGAVDEVVADFVSGAWNEQAYLMPGCGRRRRFRRRHRGGRGC